MIIIDWIVKIASVVTACTIIITAFVAIIRFFYKKWKNPIDVKNEISLIKQDVASLHDLHAADMERVTNELELLMYGMTAALNGLKQKGCNGPVTEALDKLEKHLNKSAHDYHARVTPDRHEHSHVEE